MFVSVYSATERRMPSLIRERSPVEKTNVEEELARLEATHDRADIERSYAVLYLDPCRIPSSADHQPEGRAIGPLQYDLLPVTTARKVMSLTLGQRIEEMIMESQANFFGSIPGIQKVGHYDFSDPECPFYCDYFVFKDEPWYQTQRSKKDSFFDFSTKVLFGQEYYRLFKKLGYTRVKCAKEGDVVIYFSRILERSNGFPIPAHYGRVVKADSAEDVLVQSKFTGTPVYEHKLELVPAAYGSEYAFFRPPLSQK